MDSVVSITTILLVVGIGEERPETLHLEMGHLVVVAKWRVSGFHILKAI